MNKEETEKQLNRANGIIDNFKHTQLKNQIHINELEGRIRDLRLIMELAIECIQLVNRKG